MKAFVVLSAIIIVFVLSGCESKNESIDEYPDSQSVDESCLIELSEISVKAHGASEYIWEETYSVEGVPLEMKVQDMWHDTDRAYMVRAKKMGELTDSIPDMVFDSMYTEIKRIICDEDPQWLRNVCTAYNMCFHPENMKTETTSMLTSYEYSEKIDTWSDDLEFYYHTYSGDINGHSYIMFIGYRRDINMLNMELWPENPGEIIGDKDFNNLTWYNSEFGGIILSDGTTIQEIMQRCKNRSVKSKEVIIDNACTFVNSIAPVLINKDDFSMNTYGNDSVDQLYYYSDSIAKSDSYERSIVDGYCIHFSNPHKVGGYINWTETGGNTPKNDVIKPSDNSGIIYSNDNGVIACSLQLDHVIENIEPVKVLKLSELKKKFSESIIKELNVDSFEGNELICTSVRFRYYRKEDESELIQYIPAWEYTLRTDNGKVYVSLWQNAIDGLLL